MIKEICTEISTARAEAIQAIFDAICLKYGITSKEDKCGFVSQICHESGEFTIKAENMNYTTPQRIVDIWPSRFTLNGGDGKLAAVDYSHNPEKLANEVYANRMGNGNQASGDGFRFRGSGFLQMTGEEAFAKYAAFMEKPIEEVSNLVRTNDIWAMDCAAWEYVVDKKLLGETDPIVIRKKVNGGVIGLAETKKYYQRALSVTV